MKRHVLETCLFVKGYLLGYIYMTLILIFNHPTSIFLYNIQFTITILRWMYLSTKYFNISIAYTTFGHYIGIRVVRSSGRSTAAQSHALRSRPLAIKVSSTLLLSRLKRFATLLEFLCC